VSMMLNFQGQSAATIDKERGLASALAIGMKIANTKFAGRGYRYWHFDANAGSGWNESVGVFGSPIVFHANADALLTGMRREAFFCDLNRTALTELLNRLDQQPQWSSCLFAHDNEEALEVFAERIRQSGESPRYAVGSVIVDPNGYWYRNAKGEGAPVRSLSEFSAQFPRIDIILNLNTRAYVLQRAQGHAVAPPLEVFASLRKSHWLVKRTHHGTNGWLLAVGRNVPTGDHRAIGFVKLESDEGHFIINLAEGDRQGKMFG
jgi:hypothetical protein